MDASQALADLAEISPQIEAAVIVGDEGTPLASTIPDEERSREVARLGRRLLDEGDAVAYENVQLTQLQVETRTGRVFALREGSLAIVATTSEEPTVGLIFYDLRSTLRALGEEEERGEA